MKLTLKEKWFVFKTAITEIPMELLTFIVVPIALLFCKKEDQRLPKWARWWDEDTYGINGEIFDSNGNLLFRDGGHCDPEKGRFPSPNKNRTYYARLRWLWRNRIGVYSTEVKGVKYADVIPESLVLLGDDQVTGYNGSKGTVEALLRGKTKDGKDVFAYFGNIVWSKKFYIRLYLGHKLFDISSIAKLPIKDRAAAFEKKVKDPNSKIYAKSVWAIHPFRQIRK